jgi:hypothetical protein
LAVLITLPVLTTIVIAIVKSVNRTSKGGFP